MKIRPLGDRVLVEPVKVEKKTKSGIVLPDTAQQKEQARGVIKAIGEGEKIKKLNLKKGLVVMFGKYSGSEIEVDRKEMKILNHDEVLAILED
jgi:chaperonin GroES